MTTALRVLAIAIALAGVVDPAFAVRRPSVVPIHIALPTPDDPTYERAVALGRSLETAIADVATSNAADPPVAMVAIGNADLRRRAIAPTFAVTLEPRVPRVDIIRAVPLHAPMGQRPSVRIIARGVGLAGKKTEFALTRNGSVLASRTHTWSSGDDAFDVDLPHVPAAAVEYVGVRATTEGAATVEAHVVVVNDARRPRIFVYEPRPSWAVSFARQAIESDVLFDVRGLARTSRGIDTRTAGAPSTLSSVDPESVDLMVVGGLDALTATDLAVLTQFATRRGGRVVLVPDGALPEPVRAAFDLPDTKVTLLEQPIELTLGAVRARASEVLVRADRAPAPTSLIDRGQVSVVTALDAWRFRDDGFQAFWRGLAADAAAAATPTLEVTVEPMLARPGDDVTVRVRLRLPLDGGEIRVPPVSGSLVPTDGADVPLRLWPGTAAGEFLATFSAPAAGQYDVRVQVGDELTDGVLVVNDRAIRPAPDRSADIASRVRSSGGAIFSEREMSTVVDRLRALPAPVSDRRIRPMHSAWWAVAFAGLLAAEWTLRRRRGLR